MRICCIFSLCLCAHLYIILNLFFNFQCCLKFSLILYLRKQRKIYTIFWSISFRISNSAIAPTIPALQGLEQCIIGSKILLLDPKNKPCHCSKSSPDNEKLRAAMEAHLETNTWTLGTNIGVAHRIVRRHLAQASKKKNTEVNIPMIWVIANSLSFACSLKKMCSFFILMKSRCWSA